MPLTLSTMRLKRGQRGAVIGQTGTGKSFLSKRLLPLTGRLAIIDPKRTFEYGNLPVCKDMRQIKKAGERWIFRPHPDDLQNLPLLDAVYKHCYEKGNYFIYNDDLVGILQVQRFPRYLQVCYQMGREKGITILSCTQRPALMPLFLMSEAQKIFAFHTNLKNDQKRICEFAPGYESEALDDLHEFFYFDCTDNKQRVAVPTVLHVTTREAK